MSLQINNRRYIGSKTSLLEEINDAIMEYYSDYTFSFMDPFGGTGVVANYFADKGCKVTVNDLLYSNYVAYMAWMSNEKYNPNIIQKKIEQWNDIDSHKLKDNYFSEKFGNKYYDNNDAKKIGYIRELLESERKQLKEREYYILLASLLYSADKIAHTCGHFESYLKGSSPVEKGVQLDVPSIVNKRQECSIYCKDANALVRDIDADVVYIDPPYNARQYVNFYHVLENLALWQKPEELEGDSMKFKRNHLKSDYSKAKAPQVFEDLIENINAKLIVVSYNNTYSAKSTASNNKISEAQIVEILNKKGIVKKREIDYKFFNAGKTDLKNHKELIFTCEVK